MMEKFGASYYLNNFPFKRLCGLFAYGLLTISCNTKPSGTDYAIVSGTVRNNSSNEIMIARIDRSHKKNIALGKDGSFVDTLEVDDPTTYIFNRDFQIALEGGYSININYDAKDPTGTLEISGKGAEINNYLRASEKVRTVIEGEDFDAFYGLEKPIFKKKVEAIRDKRQSLLNSLSGLSTDLRKREEANILYNYLNYLDQYPDVNRNILKSDAKDLEYEGIAAELEGLDYANEGDFRYSQAYVLISSQYFDDRVVDRVKNTGLDWDSAFFEIMDSIPQGSIRNSHLYGYARTALSNSKDVKDFYKRFMALSTDNFQRKAITEKYDKLKKLLPGETSPSFVDYENFTGGKSSLRDFQGRYVYIDLWATWCKPCLAELPALKKLAATHEGKGIEFVSISVDRKNEYSKWRKMIEDRQLGGTQLIADRALNSDFVRSYEIKAIPRFILIDPEGRILDSNAPIPSSGKLEGQFKSFGL